MPPEKSNGEPPAPDPDPGSAHTQAVPTAPAPAPAVQDQPDPGSGNPDKPIEDPAQPRASLLSDLRQLPRPFWILFTGTFINRFGTFVLPFLTIYLIRQGYTLPQAGLAISAYGAGALAASLIGGHLADTIGRRHTMVLGSWGAAVCLIAMYYARGLPVILTVAVINGFANALYGPAASALIADLVPAALRVRAYAALRFAINAGFGIGSAAAGFLANHSFAWLFYGDAFTLLLFGGITLAFLPHGNRHRAGSEGHIPWSHALRHIRRDPVFLSLCASAFLGALVFSQFNTAYGLEVARRGFSTTVYGSLLALNGLLVILFELPLTSLTLRHPPRRVIALGYVLLGGGFALNATGQTLTTLILSMTIFTLGEMLAMPMQSAYTAQLAPSRLRGRYSGAMSTAWSCASMVGPATGLWIFSSHHTLLWLGCGLAGLLAAAVILHRRPDSTGPLAEPSAT